MEFIKKIVRWFIGLFGKKKKPAIIPKPETLTLKAHDEHPQKKKPGRLYKIFIGQRVNTTRQLRKRLCKKYGITMKKLRRLEKISKRKGVTIEALLTKQN